MIEQRTPEWHAARIGRVTGSAVGAILGLSPYAARQDVMRSMVRAAHSAPSEFTGNAATEWGTYNEKTAIGEFEMETGRSVRAMPFVPYEDWLGASPDGLVEDDMGLEAKCPYYIRNDPAPIFKSVEEQPHYYAQMQIEAFCCGWIGVFFWQWTPHGNLLKIVRRNDDWLNQHLPILRQFHAEYLHEVANNADEHLAPRRVTVDTPQAAKMVAEWDSLQEAIERATERKKDLLEEMVTLAGDRNADFSGRKLTLTKREGAVSYAKAIKELAPDADLSKWRGRPSEFWGLK